MQSCKRLAAAAMFAVALPAAAQTPAQPNDGSLVLNPDARQWAFRTAGIPWICMADGRCVQIRFDGVAPGQLAAAEIAPLGFAGNTYYLAVRHADLAAGRQRAFRCVADSCKPADLPPGDFAFLGTHSLTLQLRLQSRTAILVRAADAPERSRLMWCTDRDCAEQAFTRDNRFELTFLGSAPMDGRSRAWVRERNGSVFGCGPAEGAGEDRFDCTPTTLVFPDVAAPASEPSDADPQALIASIEDAIRRGNWGEADRVIAEGRARFPQQPQWAQLTQRLAQLRAERDGRARIAQARRLVADARRYSEAGDFRAAESVLEEAARLSPGLSEIAQARADIARMRAERAQRFRERGQLVAAIQRAIGAFRLWEADGLIAEALQRFPNDPEFLNFDRQVDRMRAQAEWQGRVRRAEQMVAAARGAMAREQFGEAERQLAAAEGLAMGLPSIRAARAELARLRIEAEERADDIRQITIDIEALLARNNIVRAERMLDFALRRHPAHPGWADLRRRIDRAKAATPPPPGPSAGPVARLIAQADAAMARKDWIDANRLIVRAEAINRTAPEVVAARLALDGKRLDALRTARRFVAEADAAVRAKDWPKAEKAVADAEAADPLNPVVQADVRRLKSAVAAGKTAGPGPIAKLLADADTAMAKKDWAEANRLIVRAEAINRADPAVVAARKNLDAKRFDALRTAKRFVAEADAAVRAKDWPKAEKAVADAETSDPLNPVVQADVRRLKAAIAAGKTAGPAPAATAPLIAAANAAIARRDWPAAHAELVKAETINRADPAVIAARQRFNDARRDAFAQAKKFVDDGNAAGRARNWPAAEKAADDALRADPTNPAVQSMVRRLRDDIAKAKAAGPAPSATAPLIAAADAAIARKDWPSANREIAKAEAINRADPAVIAARKRLDDARRDAFTKAEPIAKAANDAILRNDRATADRLVAQVRLIDPFGPAVRFLAGQYRKKGW